ncbi:MAG: CHY zinc finger protein [Halolamina sp.]
MDVHGYTVRGVDVGPETRCRHYDSELDVIAIRFPCCETFYPCYECHLAAADHTPEQWGDDDGDAPAVLCGICGAVQTVAAYVEGGDRCPDCGAEFNPGCRRHYDRYFSPALFGEER